MKIIAILIVRDEEDIIALSLSRFSEQFDFVYVYDTGSVDSTWDIIMELSKECSNVIPVARERVFFSDGIRGFIWPTVREKLRDGDWVGRVDADEIYHIAPKEFIASAIGRLESVIYCQYYDFQPVPSEFPARASVPDLNLEARLRHYRVSPFFGEPRLFKYYNSMRWYPGEFGPRAPGMLAKHKIPVRHYPARSQQQLMKRTALRQITFEVNPGAWGSPKKHHWQLDVEKFMGKAHDPNLRYWSPNSELELVLRVDHLSQSHSGLRKQFTDTLHRTGLISIKDYFRPAEKSSSWRPRPMPQEVADRILEEYKDIAKICE